MKTKPMKPKPKPNNESTQALVGWRTFFDTLDVVPGDLIIVPTDLVRSFSARLNQLGFSRKAVECNIDGHTGVKITGMLSDRPTPKQMLLDQLAVIPVRKLTAVVEACKKQGLIA